jgi:hypothetical protein
MRFCYYCSNDISDKPSNARFCSDACKMNSYRRRKNPKAYETLSARGNHCQCKQCGRDFQIGTFDRKRFYCSLTCKAKAKSERRKLKGSMDQLDHKAQDQ